MGALNNLYVSSSFQGLLKMTNSATGLTSTLQTVEAGDGSDSPLQMSLTAINISGSFTVNNLPITGSTSGTSGTSGSSGTAGSSGSSGTAGTSGSSGSSGTSGVNGSSGSSGTSGINGTSGTSGFNGSSGSSGTAGSSGTSGSSGVSGSSGTSGSSGVSGSSGTSGGTGSSGTSGDSGSSGTSGTSGLVDYTGLITTGSIAQVQSITGSLTVSGKLNNTGSFTNVGDVYIFNQAFNSSSLKYNITGSNSVTSSNIIFGVSGGAPNPLFSGSVVMSGSNNIMFAAGRLNTITGGTTDTYGYIGGNNNIIGINIPTLNVSSSYRPIFSNNNINAIVALSFLTASFTGNTTPNISNNMGVAGVSLNHQSGSLNFNNNIIGGSGIVSQMIRTPQALVAQVTNNTFIGGGTTNLNHNSSSITYQNNIGTVTINNNYTSSVSTGVNNITVTGNLFTGINNVINVSGSNSAIRRVFNNNTLLGLNNTVNSEHSASVFTGGHLVATTLLGQGLFVSASNTSTTNGGTVIVGRFNATGTTQESSQDNVFIVGNGGSDGSRRNAIRVDATGTIFLTGSVRVSGSITNFGGGNINNNTTYGDNALPSNTTGTNNIAFGNNALQLSVTGSFNTAIGSNALSKSQNANNTAIGSSALQNLIIGSQNMAIGTNTLQQNVSGSYNTAIGNSALQNTVSGSQNVAIGFNALQNNSADNNLAIGFTAMQNNTTGQGNTAIGANNPLSNNTTGNNNTVIGNAAFVNNVSGSGNIAIGRNSGLGETGDNNLYINSISFAGVDNSRSGSIIWGQMNSTTANQTLQLNASTTITNDLTIASGSGTNDLFMYGHKMFNVGSFYSTATQTSAAGVSSSITYDTTDISQGVSVVAGSQITLANAGVYNIQFSAQVLSTTGSDDVWFWLKKNGTNIPDTAGRVTLANNEEIMAAWNYVVSANAGDYIELVWQNLSGNGLLLYNAPSGNIPAVTSIITTVTQVR